MKNKKMEWIYIILSVVGFTTWTFFHISFVKNSLNPTATTRLLFPIIVPLLASITVYVAYLGYFKQSPNRILLDSFKSNNNWKFIVWGSLGLALGYFTYTLAISYPDSKNAAIIPALNVGFITLVLFFVHYENDKFNFELKASLPEIIGAAITVSGILLMKYGNDWFNIKK